MDSSTRPLLSRLPLALGLLVCLVIGVVATPARAAATGAIRGGAVHAPAHPVTAAPVSPPSLAATIKQQTGLDSSQVSTQNVCGAPTPNRVSCLATVLVSKRTHHALAPQVALTAAHSRLRGTSLFSPSVTVGANPLDEPTGIPPPDAGTPAFVQQAYDLGYLSANKGTGDTIAVVDAFDDPNAAADMQQFRSTFGLPACGTANNCFSQVNQTGQTSPLPPPDSTGNWEVEESLDLDAVSALCPLCHIVLVEANSAAPSDVQTAVQTADSMGADQISLSLTLGLPATTAAPGKWVFNGVSTLAATGDHGYSGANQVNVPAGNPGVTAVGGTTLTAASNARGFAESAWSDSGSGCAPLIRKPPYQTGTCTGRSVADVSAVADGADLDVYDSTPYQGNTGWFLVGGTSLATPLTAAFEAVTGIDSTTNSPSWFYVNANLLNDVTTGNNDSLPPPDDTGGMCDPTIAYICNAGTGYDGPTGNGTISGDVVPGPPGIGGTYSSSVAGTTAVVAGGIYPNSQDTTYQWEYGTSTSYGQLTPSTPQDIGFGASLVPVSTTLTGLTPGITYHYRLVATNGAGPTQYGYDESFVTPRIPTNTALPTITTSMPQVGVSIQSQPGTWDPSGTPAYQWQDCTASDGSGCTNVVGATSSSYTPSPADVGLFPRVAVTETNSFGSSLSPSYSATVGPIAPTAPVNTSAPTITTATPQVGVSIQAQAGTWNPSGTPAYQWQDCTAGNGTGCANIAGATSSSYVPSSGDVGLFPRVAVTETNQSGSSTAASATVGPIATPPAPPTTTTTTPTPTPTTTTPTPTPTTTTPTTTTPKQTPPPARPKITRTPKLTGHAVVGSIVRLSGGRYTGGTLSKVSYYRCTRTCKLVSSKTRTYKLSKRVEGDFMRARVTVAGKGGTLSAWAAGKLGPVRAAPSKHHR